MDVWIVLLPLAGALIAGLGNRRLGDKPAQFKMASEVAASIAADAAN